MNLSEYSFAKSWFMMTPQGETPLIWKGCATKISIMAFALGTYFLIFRNREFSSLAKWFQKFNKKEPKENDFSVENTPSKELLNYNEELCPICLSAPKCGVKAHCGHLLCATCLESYCQAREVSSPPPCPLCRAPLDSLTLTCEQDLNLSLKEFTKADIKPSEKTLAWIREYNRHRGQIARRNSRYFKFFTRRTASLFINLLNLCLIIALIETRVQTLSWIEWITFNSCLGIILCIICITIFVICIWIKYQNLAALD